MPCPYFMKRLSPGQYHSYILCNLVNLVNLRFRCHCPTEKNFLPVEKNFHPMTLFNVNFPESSPGLHKGKYYDKVKP